MVLVLDTKLEVLVNWAILAGKMQVLKGSGFPGSLGR
jgi:hypothetical protein